jgi:SAM-dependent methyltransferase
MRGTNIYWQDFTGAGAEIDSRAAVGGMWDSLGELQLGYLKAVGLRPEHRLLDIGCGSLRGGVRFVEYLEPGGYFGLDVNSSLLDAGRRELETRGLAGREVHLLADDAFRLDRFGVTFHFAVAISVFTHLFANQIARCLAAVRPVLAPEGALYFTYFEAPRPGHVEPIVHEPGGITTSLDRDPFHYSREELRRLAAPHGLALDFPGEWGHPRGQVMARAVAG